MTDLRCTCGFAEKIEGALERIIKSEKFNETRHPGLVWALGGSTVTPHLFIGYTGGVKIDEDIKGV